MSLDNYRQASSFPPFMAQMFTEQAPWEVLGLMVGLLHRAISPARKLRPRAGMPLPKATGPGLPARTPLTRQISFTGIAVAASLPPAGLGRCWTVFRERSEQSTVHVPAPHGGGGDVHFYASRTCVSKQGAGTSGCPSAQTAFACLSL